MRHALVEILVLTRLGLINRRRLDADELRRHAMAVVRGAEPAAWHVIQTVMGELLARSTDRVVAGGWGPADLVELVARCADPRHVPVVLTALHDESRRNSQRGAAWLAALADLGDDPRVRIRDVDELASALQVAAQLNVVPVLDAVSLPRSETSVTHPKLAKVRALLAKAESTPYEEEAEALSAKAQELISRYALGRLVEESEGAGGTRASIGVRRIWLDPPYVRAKSSLVDQVAKANHARAAVCEEFRFSLVVGAASDLDAVELLVTSLLVQANRAMLRLARHQSSLGTSRTRSFRRAFLLAFAVGIGERLRDASDAVVGEDKERLLPVLRDHDRRVSDAFDAMVPHTLVRGSGISNREGWAAGLAAADLAQLDVRRAVSEAAG